MKVEDGMVLGQIVEKKKESLVKAKRRIPLDEVKRRAGKESNVRDFRSAIKRREGRGISLIAEIKKVSPVKGVLRTPFDVEEIALEYERGGASAVSVITEENFFHGSPDYIEKAHSSCHLPVLRKDFIFDIYQIYESRMLGADAVLLIAALLDSVLLQELLDAVRKLKMTPLVEVHDEEELERALDCGGDVVGINTRNLRTMEIDLRVAENLIRFVPKGVITVAESGVKSREDVIRLEFLGFDSVLIGEAVVTA
ncbi:MAG: indole-3-glycerol phosphate synthase TrpC, partial [Planctomycetota bacterium]|nr:indole-3-glycerol phosphate synthase TrpC [Planctomycetota bacterium]